MRFRRTRWDTQPTEPCEVMLASDGRQDFTKRAVAEAAALAVSGNVAVVTIAKIYGTQFGLPNPGLMPTKAELEERRGWVEAAIDALQSQGVEADGQVAAARRATKRLANIARIRTPRVIVIDETPATGWRRFVEGDVGSELRKKLRKDGIEVEIVSARGEDGSA